MSELNASTYSEQIAAKVAGRDDWLHRTVAALSADERVLAIALVGSFGRGDQDEWSDIDMLVILRDDVLDEFVRTFTDEVSQFGSVLLRWDAFQNAPEGGAHICVLHEVGDLPFWVDWHLWSDQIAAQSSDSRSVFVRPGFSLPESRLTFREYGDLAWQPRHSWRFRLNHPPAAVSNFAMLRGALNSLARGHDVGDWLRDLGATGPIPEDALGRIGVVRELLDRYSTSVSPQACQVYRALADLVEESVRLR